MRKGLYPSSVDVKNINLDCAICVGTHILFLSFQKASVFPGSNGNGMYQNIRNQIQLQIFPFKMHIESSPRLLVKTLFSNCIMLHFSIKANLIRLPFRAICFAVVQSGGGYVFETLFQSNLVGWR